MSYYIVASNKDWHRKGFDSFQKNNADQWAYVSTREELEAALEKGRPRYVFFLHWSWLVPKEIWSTVECVCFHMADVPYGRGGSPLQNLIHLGLTSTKMSALRMVEEMDAGPVYMKMPMSLEGRAEEIYLQGGEVCWNMIAQMITTEPGPVEQRGEATVFKRRRPEQSALPSNGTSKQLYDHIRMLDAPTYPLAFVQHGDFRIEFSHAELNGDEISVRAVIRPFKTGEKNV